MVDVRLFHQFEELAGIGRQALDIAALALGIDRVEGEGGFARAAQPGDDRQRVARDLDIDVPEIVLARAAHPDVGHPGPFDNIGVGRRPGDGIEGSGHWVGRKIGHSSGGIFNSAIGPSACPPIWCGKAGKATRIWGEGRCRPAESRTEISTGRFPSPSFRPTVSPPRHFDRPKGVEKSFNYGAPDPAPRRKDISAPRSCGPLRSI